MLIPEQERNYIMKQDFHISVCGIVNDIELPYFSGHGFNTYILFMSRCMSEVHMKNNMGL